MRKTRHFPGKRKSLAWWMVIALTILYIGFFSTLAIRQHRAFTTHGFDLGNADQATWNTLHGHFLRMTNEIGTESRLGTHVDPIIALLSPFYLLYSSPETLLIAQTIALALGVWPIYWLSKEKLSSDWAGAAFALIYLAFPALEGANLSEFHAVTLGASFLAWAFYFLHRDRRAFFVLFILLAMSCKEEIPLIVAMMGLYAFFIQRKRKLGLLTFIGGLAWFVIALKVIFPGFNDSGQSIHLSHYGYLGNSIGEVLLNVLTKPELVMGNFQNPLKALYLVKLLFPVGYLSLLAPHILLIAAPEIVINFLSTHYTMYALDMFWGSVTIVPFIVLSAAWGVAFLKNTLHRWLKVKQGFVVTLFTGYALLFTVFYHQQLGYSPLNSDFTWPQITAHHLLGEELARSIPQDAVVVAQDHLNPHVSHRETLYIFPFKLEEADYVFVDVSREPGYRVSFNEYLDALQTLLQNPDFGVVTARDGYILLKRGAEQRSLDPAFYQVFLADEVKGTITVDFGDTVQLLGLSTAHTRGSIIKIETFWRLLQTPEDDLRLFVTLVDKDGLPIQGTIKEMQALVAWYPPSKWASGQTIYGRETIQLPFDVNSSALSVGIFVGSKAAVGRVDARAPVVIEDANGRQIQIHQNVLLAPLEKE